MRTSTPHVPAADGRLAPRRRASTRAALVVATVLATALALLAPAAHADTISDTVEVRLPDPGDNSPAAIALRFSRATFPEGDVQEVLLATTSTFADALASGTLQGGDTPLLLTDTAVLRDDVAAEIERLGAEEVTILGGVEAVSARVEDDLLDLGVDVDRIAGTTRIETAVAIAERTPRATTALLARGFGTQGDDTQAFADALAAGAWAAEEGWPVLLTQTEVLTSTTAEWLEDSAITDVIVLGGEAAIGPDVVTALEALGLQVDRVSGATRFDTAVAIAAERGFDDAGDAARTIVVEGQAPDAWAAGFAAAAHGALVPAPIVLANGPALPEATRAFIVSGGVDVSDVDAPVLVCATDPVACEQARQLLGLPLRAALDLGVPDDGVVPSRTALVATLDVAEDDVRVAVSGPCVTDGFVVLGDSGRFTVDVQAAPGPCTIAVEVAFPNGTVQAIERTIEVGPAAPADGVVVDTETGGDAYTLVPDRAAGMASPRPLQVAYSADDTFRVNGEPATIGAFEAAITVADRITFSADTADGTVHDLRDVDPSTITSGTVGQVDLAAETFAIIEPVSGVVLRGGLPLTDDAGYAIGSGSGTATRAAFEADLNEGDRIAISGTTYRLTNQRVTGEAADVAVDQVSGIARFRAGALGDDPLNAEDDRFRARGDAGAAQTFRVDGDPADFATFAAELSAGDDVAYARAGGVEAFELDNAPLPPVVGTVTETSDPDGSAVAPEPRDGGSVVVLTAEGRTRISYSPDATFRIDGALATEEELEAALTAGDLISYQVEDPATGTEEEIAIDDRDLTGTVADITEGADSYDVVTAAGVVYDDLSYTSGVFGGTDSYAINGSTVGLAQFENELALIDRGEVTGTVTVRAVATGTEHRLVTEDAQ